MLQFFQKSTFMIFIWFLVNLGQFDHINEMIALSEIIKFSG